MSQIVGGRAASEELSISEDDALVEFKFNVLQHKQSIAHISQRAGIEPPGPRQATTRSRRSEGDSDMKAQDNAKSSAPSSRLPGPGRVADLGATSCEPTSQPSATLATQAL